MGGGLGGWGQKAQEDLGQLEDIMKIISTIVDRQEHRYITRRHVQRSQSCHTTPTRSFIFRFPMTSRRRCKRKSNVLEAGVRTRTQCFRISRRVAWRNCTSCWSAADSAANSKNSNSTSQQNSTMNQSRIRRYAYLTTSDTPVSFTKQEACLVHVPSNSGPRLGPKTICPFILATWCSRRKIQHVISVEVKLGNTSIKPLLTQTQTPHWLSAGLAPPESIYCRCLESISRPCRNEPVWRCHGNCLHSEDQ